MSYLISWGLIGFVTLYPLEANKEPTLWSNLHNSLFISLSRPIFLISLSIIIVNLYLDNGLIAKKFLSSNKFAILAKFSYAIYLIFPIVISILVSSMTSSLYLSYNEMFWLLCYNVVASFLFGFLVHLIIEKPID